MVFRGAGRSIQAAGLTVSTASDLALWMQFQLDLGRNQDGVQVVSEEAMRRVRTPEVSDKPATFIKPDQPAMYAPFLRYGLGLFLGYHRGRIIRFDISKWPLQ